MENQPHIIPDAAVKGIARGLFLMASFTTLWAGIAFGGLIGTVYAFALAVFLVLAVFFVLKGIALHKLAKYFPQVTSDADKAEGKRIGKWFGIIFGAEGLLIFVGVNVVINLGYPNLVIPVIALVVGLHFFPLAKVFKRSVDYYLATWATLIAVCGFIFTLNKTMPVNYIQAFIGVGIALATSAYGIYMVFSGNKVAGIIPLTNKAGQPD
jgi:hypothetical protein